MRLTHTLAIMLIWLPVALMTGCLPHEETVRTQDLNAPAAPWPTPDLTSGFGYGESSPLPAVEGLSETLATLSRPTTFGFFGKRTDPCGIDPESGFERRCTPEIEAEFLVLRDLLRAENAPAYFALRLSSRTPGISGRLALWQPLSGNMSAGWHKPADGGTPERIRAGQLAFLSGERQLLSGTWANLTEKFAALSPRPDSSTWLVFLDDRFRSTDERHFVPLARFGSRTEVAAQQVMGFDFFDSRDGSLAGLFRFPAWRVPMANGHAIEAIPDLLPQPMDAHQDSQAFGTLKIPGRGSLGYEMTVRDLEKIFPNRALSGEALVLAPTTLTLTTDFSHTGRLIACRTARLESRETLCPVPLSDLRFEPGVPLSFNVPKLTRDLYVPSDSPGRCIWQSLAIILEIDGVRIILAEWHPCPPLGGGKGVIFIL